MTAPIKLKFRPSLTLAQIEYILSLRGNDPIIEHEIRKSLEPFKRKADAGIISPSHIATGKVSMADSLGFTSNEDTIESLLKIWESKPNSLSPKQLQQVNQYRYINDMMTEKEERDYEGWNTQFGD